jgi:hypothetical protein
MSLDSSSAVQRDSATHGAPQLNLKRLQTIQRWLQYGALAVLVVFMGLIAFSWLELRKIKTEIDEADNRLLATKAEIAELAAYLEQLKIDKKGLEDVNAALTTVTRSIGKESRKEAPNLKTAIEETITPTEELQRVPPRVYIQISNEEQRPAAAIIAKHLQASGYIVPGIENVGDKAPSVADLRYFQSDDGTRKDVEDIRDKCSGWGLKLVVPPKPLPGYIRPRRYEIWFAKNSGTRNPDFDLKGEGKQLLDKVKGKQQVKPHL